MEPTKASLEERIAALDFLASKHVAHQVTVRWKQHLFTFPPDKIADAKQILPELIVDDTGYASFQTHVAGTHWRQSGEVYHL